MYCLQIAALMERCKRNEEDAAEKARTVDALRRKLALAGRPCSSASSTGMPMGSAAGATHLGLPAGNSSMMMHHSAASGPVGGGLYTGGLGSPNGGLSNVRRSWAAESVGFGGSPAGSPTRSLGSYGPY